MRCTSLGIFLASASSVFAAVVTKPAVLDHDKVVSFAQSVTADGIGASALRFQPSLTIKVGCHPYAAVNAAGDVSGGLDTGGLPDGQCNSRASGQVYVRSTWHNGRYCYMYSWYFPKDQPPSVGVFGVGHRHDWEGIITCINNPDVSSQNILAISASAHGGWNTQNPPASSSLTGTSPNVVYSSTAAVTNHALSFGSSAGGKQPVIQWEKLTPAARNTLNTWDFGKANCPFNDNNFINNLNKAGL